MRIGLDNMDPVVAKAIAARLCGPRDPFISPDIEWSKPRRRRIWEDDGDDSPKKKRKRRSTSEENFALLLRKRRDEIVARRATITSVPSIILGAGLGAAIYYLPGLGHHLTIAAVAGIAVSAGGVAAGGAWASRASPRRALEYEVVKEELRAVLPYLTLSRAERVYCDILVMLSDFEANQAARREIRTTLTQLNGLLQDSRRLERQRKSLLPALGASPVKELAEQQQTLEDRISEEDDDITRESLAQSRTHIQTRIENSRSLEQALQRISAQEESIVNALSSSMGALARMQVAPSIQTETAAKEISQTVDEMNRRTTAVEEAVREVLTLR